MESSVRSFVLADDLGRERVGASRSDDHAVMEPWRLMKWHSIINAFLSNFIFK